jgi:hypothetical protein
MPYVYDGARDMWVFPDSVRADADGYEVNLSNTNAFDLLEAMGLRPESAGLVAIDSFSGMVAAAVRRHLDRRSPAIAPTTDHQPGRMTIHHCGRRGGYIESRLGDLARLVENARGDGATHIGWG